MPTKFESVTLRNGEYKFSTWSNYPESEIFSSDKKWSRALILLHGFPDNNNSYDELRQLLAKGLVDQKGNEPLILIPLMRGYEPSSQHPSFNEYSISHLASDVKAWVEAINPNNAYPIHLVGHDWGALTVFRSLYEFPDLITSAMAMAIPYVNNLNPLELAWYAPKQAYYSTYMITMQSSYLYHDRLTQRESTYLRDLWKFWSPTWNFDSRTLDDVKSTLLGENVVDHATAYYRCIPRSRNIMKFKHDFNKVPLLILGGEVDGCMHKGLFERQKTKLKDQEGAGVEILKGVGHFLHREDPQRVADLTTKWFQKYN